MPNPRECLQTWASRNKDCCTPNRCRFWTEGTKAIKTVDPRDNDPVSEEWPRFDSCIVTGFEAYLQKKGIQHTISVGLYGDVCIDTTAQSAFQKDYWVSVVHVCVGNLYLNSKEWEDSACKIYGARILDVDRFAHLPGMDLEEADSTNRMKARLV